MSPSHSRVRPGSDAVERARLDPTDPVRLLPRPSVAGYAGHLDRYGPVPHLTPALIDDIEAAGLAGRGGAGFPTATKLRAVAGRGRRRVVVANGTEGEPASAKDKVLLSAAPHLVLDGVDVVTQLLGAGQAYLCVDRNWPDVRASVERASHERAGHLGRRPPLRVLDAPDRYVAGEETALINWLNGAEAKPSFVPPRPFERGVRGRPTFTSNVETYAQLGLIARYGADWYRALGTAAAPGTTLLTVTGAVAQPGVCEAPGGSSLRSAIDAAGGPTDGIQAVLVGGYFGTWIPGRSVDSVDLDRISLSGYGASLGCGVVAVLGDHHCPLVEVARVARWLADQNAGQCGPCVHGLPAIADALQWSVGGHPVTAAQIDGLVGLVKGRGACKHPDGMARFVDSSMRVFDEHLAQHRRHGPCPVHQPVLPVPQTGGWR
jgi:NADH:ubiquinone oxidoreductase subunit F (NADH-binding)